MSSTPLGVAGLDPSLLSDDEDEFMPGPVAYDVSAPGRLLGSSSSSNSTSPNIANKSGVNDADQADHHPAQETTNTFTILAADSDEDDITRTQSTKAMTPSSGRLPSTTFVSPSIPPVMKPPDDEMGDDIGSDDDFESIMTRSPVTPLAALSPISSLTINSNTAQRNEGGDLRQNGTQRHEGQHNKSLLKKNERPRSSPQQQPAPPPSTKPSSTGSGSSSGARGKVKVTGLTVLNEKALPDLNKVDSGKDDGNKGDGTDKNGSEGDGKKGEEGKEEKAVEETPMKTLQVSIIGLVAFVNILNSVIIFPFLPFFTAYYYPDVPTSRIGVHVGMLASSYFVGDMIGSLIWGRFADTYGRKPAVNIGLVTSCIGIILFPFSPTYWTAVTIRFLSGLLCGNNSLTRTMMSEACDDTNQHRGFSLIGLSTGLARLFAPGIGGLLALPATKYEMFKGTIFEVYAFFLPCLVGGFLTFIGIVLVTFWLDETLPPRPEAVALLPGAKSDEHEMGVVKGGKLTAVDSQASQSKETDLYSAVTHPTVLNIIFIYFVHSFVGVISHEIIPMWVVNKKEDHGFEMNTSEIGGILTLVAPFQVAFQGFAYPVLAARWKYIKLFKVCVIFYGIALVLMPYTSLLAYQPKHILWPAFIGVCSLAVCARMGAFTCIFVLLSNSCNKDVRASINGIGQSASSAGRMLGPTFAGAIFSWSLNNGQPYPFNYHFLFLVLAVCCATSYVGAMYFSAELDYQKGSAKQLELERAREETERLERKEKKRMELSKGGSLLYDSGSRSSEDEEDGEGEGIGLGSSLLKKERDRPIVSWTGYKNNR